MAKRKKKKSIFRSTFYRVYFALVIVALVGIAVGVHWLRGMLADYEAAQPVYVAEDVAKLFENADYENLYNVDTSAQEIAQGDRSFYVDSMKRLAAGKTLAWSEAFSPNEDEKLYNVTLDGDRFATFRLVPSGQKSDRGNRLWTLGSVTTHVQLREPEPTPEPTPEPVAQTWQCRVTAPQGYVVTANGVTLDGENSQTSEKTLFEAGFLPENVPNPVMIEYVFESDTETPDISAVDDAGAAATVTAESDKPLAWSCALKENEVYKQQYAKAAYALGQRVAKFMSKDASKRAIQKICAKGSPAEAIFENLNNTFATPHSGQSFKNEAVTQFYTLAENCFTCHVSFDYVLKTKAGDKVYPTGYTFCIIQSEGKSWLYNMLSY